MSGEKLRDFGQCHCGKLRWEVQIPKSAQGHILCHCETCKVMGGGTCSLNQIIHKDDLTIIQGKPKVYTYYGASGNPVNCYFCPSCTTHVYHHQAIMGDQIVVRTYPLQGGKRFQPVAEIFGSARLNWVGQVANTYVTVPDANGGGEMIDKPRL